LRGFSIWVPLDEGERMQKIITILSKKKNAIKSRRSAEHLSINLGLREENLGKVKNKRVNGPGRQLSAW
jgi:hypothetical protein